MGLILKTVGFFPIRVRVLRVDRHWMTPRPLMKADVPHGNR